MESLGRRDRRPNRGLGGFGIRFRNVVFMGMGEPLDNPEGVHGALGVLGDPRGLSYIQERIPVCTASPVEGIRRLGPLGLRRLNLSVSLAAFVGRIGRSLVNVIPYNPGRLPIVRSLKAACGELGGLS